MKFREYVLGEDIGIETGRETIQGKQIDVVKTKRGIYILRGKDRITPTIPEKTYNQIVAQIEHFMQDAGNPSIKALKDTYNDKFFDVVFAVQDGKMTEIKFQDEKGVLLKFDKVEGDRLISHLMKIEGMDSLIKQEQEKVGE